MNYFKSLFSSIFQSPVPSHSSADPAGLGTTSEEDLPAGESEKNEPTDVEVNPRSQDSPLADALFAQKGEEATKPVEPQGFSSFNQKSEELTKEPVLIPSDRNVPDEESKPEATDATADMIIFLEREKLKQERLKVEQEKRKEKEKFLEKQNLESSTQVCATLDSELPLTRAIFGEKSQEAMSFEQKGFSSFNEKTGGIKTDPVLPCEPKTVGSELKHHTFDDLEHALERDKRREQKRLKEEEEKRKGQENLESCSEGCRACDFEREICLKLGLP